jgi:hypothetical protein
MENKSSIKVTLFRAGSFLGRAQGKDMVDYFADSKHSIGAYWESSESKRIGSGMTMDEEKLLLPEFIEVSKEDREYTKKRAEFYAEIDTKIPFTSGRVLEIGLTDNHKPLSVDNMPIEIMDYIRYRHAITHPFVAVNKEEADGNPLKQFYIFNKSELQKKTTKKTEEKDAALRIYLEVKDDKPKTEMMLTLMGIDPRGFAGKNEGELLIEELRKLSETKPNDFIKVYSSRNLETTYWIKTLVNCGVFKVVATKYIDNENGNIIGNTLEETEYFFEDKMNSDSVIVWKARYQEKQYNNIKNKQS